MHQLKFKAERIGSCRLCGKLSTLTWDHVPPKACGNAMPTEIQSFADTLSRQPDKRVQLSQNGLKYRTLCSDCNNRILGKNLDVALSDFLRGVISIVESAIHLPEAVDIECDIDAVCLCVLGHLVAANITDHRSVFDETASKCVLNERLHSLDAMHMYGWIYPYSPTLIFRDFVIHMSDEPVFCQFFATFPFAFLVTGSAVHLDVTAFRPDHTQQARPAKTVSVPTSDIKPYGWPWHPDFSGLVFGGDALMRSTISRRRPY